LSTLTLRSTFALRILLIRHGETTWNAQGKVQGSADSPLTDEGVQQAVLTGRRLANLPTARIIYTSPLPRAKRTAELIAKELGSSPIGTSYNVVEEAALRERSFGIFEGQRWSEIKAQYPEELERGLADPGYAMPGGENRVEVLDRSFSFLERLSNGDVGTFGAEERVVVVTHSGVISCLLKRILGLRQEQPRTFAVPNLGIIDLVRSRSGEWQLLSLGDTSHLQ